MNGDELDDLYTLNFYNVSPKIKLLLSQTERNWVIEVVANLHDNFLSINLKKQE